jgi:hypothetical protein
MNPDQPPIASPRPATRPAVASAVLAALLFAVTLGGTYVYDDQLVVRDDPRVHAPARWGHLWTQSYNGSLDNLYRPIVSTSYALEWWLHGDRPWAFHAVNVLLHAAVAAAVATLAYRGTGRAAAAWGAGLLFAALPVHAEAVANIVGRAELACALALLASLVLLARRPLTPARAAAVVGCGVVAVLSKEQGVLAPLLWVGWVALVWRVPPVPGRERATVRGATLAVVWLWAGYLAAREHYLKFNWDRSLLDRSLQPMVHTVGIDRLLLPVALLGRYAVLLAWPLHLSPDYGGDVIGASTGPADPFLWAGGAAVLAAAALAGIAWRRRAGFTVFALLAAAATYAVVGNLVTLIGTIFAERLIYLPSAFLALLAGAALARLPASRRAVALVVLLVPMSVLTARAAAAWNRPAALFTRALADHPGSVQLHLLVAQADADAGRQADRAAVLDDACRRFPDLSQCWAARARAAADVGDFPTAEAAYAQGVTCAFNPSLLDVSRYIADREAAARWRRPPTTRATGGR